MVPLLEPHALEDADALGDTDADIDGVMLTLEHPELDDDTDTVPHPDAEWEPEAVSDAELHPDTE